MACAANLVVKDSAASGAVGIAAFRCGPIRTRLAGAGFADLLFKNAGRSLSVAVVAVEVECGGIRFGCFGFAVLFIDDPGRPASIRSFAVGLGKGDCLAVASLIAHRISPDFLLQRSAQHPCCGASAPDSCEASPPNLRSPSRFWSHSYWGARRTSGVKGSKCVEFSWSLQD